VARNARDLEQLTRETSAKIIVADATDEQASERILSETKPNLLVLSAGTPLELRPLHEHTWETFSKPWEVDTKLTFLWVQAVLRANQGPEHVVVFGSGAALFGSPLSGGYAGAKKMNAFIAEYASGVASRAKRPIRFHCLVPPMSPHTEFGAAAARAYAKMAGQTFEDFVKQLPSPPSPADIGAAVVALHEDPKKWNQVSYGISAKGLAPVEIPNSNVIRSSSPRLTKKDEIIYWTTTGIVVGIMLWSAINFAFNPAMKGAFTHFGLPNWFRIELTVAKFLGAFALLIPGIPRMIKDFAYAGFAITLMSAPIAHLSSGDPIFYEIGHATFFICLVVSYLYYHKRIGGAA